MKYIIIGLGHFGTALGQKLTLMGHEVIGVDPDMVKVEAGKTLMAHTVCMNPADAEAVNSLPIKEADAVVVCIGVNEGANILATAMMKQMGARHLIVRAISPLHRTVLEAMQVDDIVYLEEETAHRWAKRLNVKGVLEAYEVTGDYHIIEAVVPIRCVGKTLEETDLRNRHSISVLTTIKQVEKRNPIGILHKVKQIQEVASAKTLLEEGDIMLLFGKLKDIQAFLNKE
jgi:trk system potassium uptake protein TrkA